MKITRELYPTQDGWKAMAFIRANPIERLFLRRAWRAGRHNLRPSRNWPGLRLHGASYVMVRKGGWNPDTGRRPGYPVWLQAALRHQYNMIDMLAVSLPLLTPWWVGLPLTAAGLSISVFLQRWRIKRETPNRL